MKMRTRMYALTLLMAFSLIHPFSGFAKITNSCDCAGEDKLFKKTKCPEPKKLKEQSFYGEACVANNKNSVTGLKKTLEDIKTPKNLKTPNEVLDYLSCYRGSDESFCHFKSTLASHIALAADSSGLPFSVQACLIFQESRFNRNAKSDIPIPATDQEKALAKKKKTKLVTKYKHAHGYVQFMPETIGQIEPILAGSIPAWQDQVKEAEADILEEKSKLAGKLSAASKTLAEKNINYYEAKINVWEAKIAARKVWDSYWEGTASPKKISLEDVKDPKIAFALSTTKQTYDLGLMEGIDFKHRKNSFLSVNGMDASDSAIFLTGVYNGGIGALANKCGDVKTLDECLKKFNRGAESWIQMSAIRNCAKKGSTENMEWDYDNKEFKSAKSCEGYKCH